MKILDRRSFLKSLTAASLFSATGCIRITKSPNFLFILVDDLGWNDLACYGSTFYETPNLDELAAAGKRFTDAYAACPVCSPTRGAIMTGKHPARLNITDWIPGNDPQNRKLIGPQDLHELPHKEITIAETLKENGYKTFFAGKWHLGDEGFFPEDQGFDINKGGHHRGSPPGGYYTPYKNPKLDDGPEGEYLTDRLTNESIHFLENNGQSPFLLFISYYTVHTPIQACKRHLKKFQDKADRLQILAEPTVAEHDGATRIRQDRADYASMVYAMDENVGRLLEKLEDLDLSENTVVIFTSDNGGLSTLPKRRNAPTSVKPLRAGKGWCYEGGIRVPLIIKAPGLTQAGSTCNTPVTSMDYFPTMLQLAHLKLMPDNHVDGKSLVPVIKGAKLERSSLFWHYPHYHGSTWTPGAAIRQNQWKLIEFYDLKKSELYNLKEDISEQHDLSDKFPEIKQKLLDKLHNWQKNIGAKMPQPNPNFKE